MNTPAGKPCKFYYEDFNRGRAIQECRLAKLNPSSDRWHPNDCSKCPVPAILLANADPDMELTITIHSGFLGFFRNVKVEAKSIKDGIVIENPYVGRIDVNCPALDIFRQALEDVEDD